MRGFGSFEAAAHFCTAHDERRDHFRSRHHMNETVSLAVRCHKGWATCHKGWAGLPQRLGPCALGLPARPPPLRRVPYPPVPRTPALSRPSPHPLQAPCTPAHPFWHNARLSPSFLARRPNRRGKRGENHTQVRPTFMTTYSNGCPLSSATRVPSTTLPCRQHVSPHPADSPLTAAKSVPRATDAVPRPGYRRPPPTPRQGHRAQRAPIDLGLPAPPRPAMPSPRAYVRLHLHRVQRADRRRRGTGMRPPPPLTLFRP